MKKRHRRQSPYSRLLPHSPFSSNRSRPSNLHLPLSLLLRQLRPLHSNLPHSPPLNLHNSLLHNPLRNRIRLPQLRRRNSPPKPITATGNDFLKSQS